MKRLIVIMLSLVVLGCTDTPDITKPTMTLKRVVIGIDGTAGGGGGDIPTRQLVYEWTAPTTGPPVIRYIGEIEIDYGDRRHYVLVEAGTDTTLEYTFTEGYKYRFRVAGIDAETRQGVMSEWSEVLDLTGGGHGVAGEYAD